MITFRQFLTETIASAKLNSTSNKDRMRVQLARSFKAVLPEMEPYFVDASTRNFKSAYNSFVEAFPAEARAIDAQRGEGVGPGELIAYFVFNNISIGGGSSSIDLFLDGEPFAEVKAGDSARGGIQDFKLDTNHSASGKALLADLSALNNLHKEKNRSRLAGLGWTW